MKLVEVTDEVAAILEAHPKAAEVVLLALPESLRLEAKATKAPWSVQTLRLEITGTEWGIFANEFYSRVENHDFIVHQRNTFHRAAQAEKGSEMITSGPDKTPINITTLQSANAKLTAEVEGLKEELHNFKRVEGELEDERGNRINLDELLRAALAREEALKDKIKTVEDALASDPILVPQGPPRDITDWPAWIASLEAWGREGWAQRTALKATITAQQARIAALEDGLHRLACLGNGELPGNSVGNEIAQKVLATPSDTSALEAHTRRVLVDAVKHVGDAGLLHRELVPSWVFKAIMDIYTTSEGDG